MNSYFLLRNDDSDFPPFLPNRADKDGDKNCDSLNQSVEVTSETKAVGLGENLITGHHCLQKSDSGFNEKMERDCVESAPTSLERSDSGTNLVEELPGDIDMGNSLALVPFQKPQEVTKSNSMVSRESSQWKSSWPVLRRMFLSKQQAEKPTKKFSRFQGVLHISNFQSSALVYPDQKQGNSDQDQASTIDGDIGAIVPYGFNHILESLPKEVLDLKDKYSSTCRLFTYEELLSATSNFMPGLYPSSLNFFGLFWDWMIANNYLCVF